MYHDQELKRSLLKGIFFRAGFNKQDKIFQIFH